MGISRSILNSYQYSYFMKIMALVLPVFFLSLATIFCSGYHLNLPNFCAEPPPRKTIPLRVTMFPNGSVYYVTAFANTKKMTFPSKCIKWTVNRSAQSDLRATVNVTEQNIRSGAITKSVLAGEEHCQGVFVFQYENKENDYFILYKLWTNSVSFVDLQRNYVNGKFDEDVFVHISRRHDLTQKEIESDFRKGNVTIDSLTIISQSNCKDYLA